MWKEYFVYGTSKTLSAGNGTAFETMNIRIDSDADFEFNKTTYVATNDRIKVKYKDDSYGRYLTKGLPDIKTLAGRNTLAMGLSNSFLPFVWPRPYIISAGTNFVVEASDFSGASNTLRIAFHGGKLRSGVAPWTRRFRAAVPFVYSFTDGAVTVSANSTANPRIEIDIDSHFVVQKITGIRTGEALVLINEGARGREWMNTQVHIDNIIGNGAFPNILTANRFIIRGSVVSFNIQDLSGADNSIEINLIGVKLYE
jgi:hypothetical protein